MVLKTLLIIGGSGNLGRSVVQNFAHKWKVANIDFTENAQATLNIKLNSQQSLKNQVTQIKNQLVKFQNGKFDNIICTAGGWEGGSVKQDSIFDTYDKMHSCNVIPSIITAHLATHLLQENGMLVFTGAGGILNNPCNDMIGYALAKHSVHTLAQKMAESKDLPHRSLVVTILPKVIDTPQNRQGMPNSDFSTWAKPEQIASLLRMWADGYNLPPKNGSFALINVKEGNVYPEYI